MEGALSFHTPDSFQSGQSMSHVAHQGCKYIPVHVSTGIRW